MRYRHCPKEQIYYVYFMISSSRRALYVGMTSGLRNRAWQHKNKVFEGFSSKYNCTRLVYFEIYDVRRKIAREKAAPEGRQLSVLRNSKARKGSSSDQFRASISSIAGLEGKLGTQKSRVMSQLSDVGGLTRSAVDTTRDIANIGV